MNSLISLSFTFNKVPVRSCKYAVNILHSSLLKVMNDRVTELRDRRKEAG
jgi:hypothetical protein